MVKAVVEGTHENQVVQIGDTAVFPVPDVVGVQTRVAPHPGTAQVGFRCSSARRSRRLIVRVDRPEPMTSPARSNHTLAGGVTAQILPLGLR